jgi:transposase
MSKPYSYDFRKKVIEAIEVDGRKKCEVSEIFNISRNTINLWLDRKKQTGDFLSEPNRPPGNNHKINDWKKFTEFASANG